MKIMSKLILLLLLITIIPIGLFGYSAIDDIKDMQNSAINNVNSMKETAIKDSTLALNSLGEQAIQQIAIDIAKQIEIYLNANPEMTVEDLQKDEYFKSIAVQQVGKTGYTAVTETTTVINRFHASEGVINLDLHNLAEKLPGFWAIMKKTENGNSANGYYDWEEADGTFRQKYMYISIVNAKTKDDIVFSVAATTYIDEFNSPAQITSEKLENSAESVSANIEEISKKISRNTMILILIMIVVSLVTAIMFAHTLVTPLQKLRIAAIKVADGQLDVEIPEIKTKDEIKDISDAVILLIGALKFLKKEKAGETKEEPKQEIKEETKQE